MHIKYKNNGRCSQHRPLFYYVIIVKSYYASFARASFIRRIASMIFSSLVA